MIKEFKNKNPLLTTNIDKNKDRDLDDAEINEAFDKADVDKDGKLS